MNILPYLPPTILISQVLAIGAGLFGTVLICTVFMSYVSRRFVQPLRHPAVWVAIVYSLFAGYQCLDRDLHIADDNQQAFLSNAGVETTARIVAVKEVGFGRFLNSRYTWAEITCEFTDNRGQHQEAVTTEGYNHVYAKVKPWAPEESWSTGATVKITYLPDLPQESRLTESIRNKETITAWNGQVVFGLGILWFVTIAWLSVWIVASIKLAPAARRKAGI